jgi:hypothetical protein
MLELAPELASGPLGRGNFAWLVLWRRFFCWAGSE